MKSVVILSALACTLVLGKKGYGPTDQEWGFVTVRKGAHMFWWLHYNTKTTNATDKPLVIWLQGGPGGSSTGFGNLGEIGPIDENGNEREYAWTNNANVLFVDNPVGTGYSYVENNEFATTNEQIADDFLELMKGFYKELPQFEDVPLYIFSESYGGKMTAEIGLRLWKGNKNGEIKCNIRGLGLGDSWISPVDSTLSWGPYLKSLGFVDEEGAEAILAAAKEAEYYYNKGQFEKATGAWGITEGVIMQKAGNVDFYNILTKVSDFGLRTRGKWVAKPDASPQEIDDAKIFYLMNGDVKKALGINVVHDSDGVFEALTEDFMKPVIHIVEELINSTDITVAVYNGQLDLIVDTPGTIAWVDKIQYPTDFHDKWVKNERSSITALGTVEGFYKKVEPFRFYWVNRAGHMVPYDNPAAMLYILKDVTDNFSPKIKAKQG